MFKKSLLFSVVCLMGTCFYAVKAEDCLFPVEDMVETSANMYCGRTPNFLSEEDIKNFQESLNTEEEQVIRDFFAEIQDKLEQTVQDDLGARFTEILVSRGIAADYVVNVLMYWQAIQDAQVSEDEELPAI